MKGVKYAPLLALVFLVGCGSSELDRAKKAVEGKLLDPESAQYRNVEVFDKAVCGEVNAKNRMGGYTGFSRFIVTTRVNLDPSEREWELGCTDETYTDALSQRLESKYGIDRSDSKQRRVRSELSMISAALTMYKADNYVYPTTEQGLAALSEKTALDPVPRNFRAGGYVKEGFGGDLPVDPWGKSYHYQSPGSHGAFDLWSLGADGKPGGTGEDADIGSWMK